MNEINLPMRIGVGVIILNNENKVFVGKRRDNPIDKWQMPQGGLDKGEDYISAMKRELYEETGYKSDSAYFIRSYLDNSAKGWPEYSCAFFWCFYDELQKINCYEGQSMKFIPRNHANVYDILEFNLSAWDLALKFSKMKKFKV